MKDTDEKPAGWELRRLFSLFNRRYFDHRLRQHRIHVVNRLAVCGRYSHHRKLILIRAGLSREETTTALLHEMVHAAVGGAHGPRFQRETSRLWAAGAPLLQDDVVGPETGLGYHARPTKSIFRAYAEDVLSEYPRASLAKVTGWAVYSQGFNCKSGAELLRKYPWVRRIYSEVRQEQLHAQKARVEALKRVVSSG